MTMHASKGLEFNTVFIAGCEDGFIPFNRFQKPCDNIEEERRLLYVGMTRARKNLFLSYAKKREQFGKSVQRHLSGFVRKIDPGLLRHEKLTPKKEYDVSIPRQLLLF
jgi:superfamily I DNA/RNA helicase